MFDDITPEQVIGLIVGFIIWLFIMYTVIKSAVRNGILEARAISAPKLTSGPPKHPQTYTEKQQALIDRYQKGGFKSWEEYEEEWNKLNTPNNAS